ncbi:MAG: SDR family oxidoreductase [Actinomycetota bacterium]|nr:SDR family oxidoreductase [Actinomycetota bacterium]
MTTTAARFEGQVAIVTGSAHGIGEAIARRFASEGAAVVIADLDESAAKATAKEIVADGGRAIGVACDVGRFDAVRALVARTMEEYGQIDILVNNAGDVTISRHFLTSDEAWWDHFLTTNLKSQFLTCRLVAPIMAKAGKGAIINMSSGGATKSHRGMVAYDASKGGVEALTRALALELAPYGIRVNNLVPGLIVTRPEHAEPVADDRRNKTVPLGRGGTPADLAGPAAFLASDDAAYMTGSTVTVDGGVLVQQRSPQVDTFPVDTYPTLEEIVPL